MGNKVILCYTCKLIPAILRSKNSEIQAVFMRINRIEHWKIPQHIINKFIHVPAFKVRLLICFFTVVSAVVIHTFYSVAGKKSIVIWELLY